MNTVVDVVAGILRDERGHLLLAQRPAGKHLAGYWEFPGGKLEPHESPDQALVRELWEEIGVVVERSEPLVTLTHDYPEKSVRLLMRAITAWNGRPSGREGQAIAWVAPDELGEIAMPAGDQPLLRVLDLPPRYVISPAPDPAAAAPAATHAFVTAWQQRLQAGARLLQLRAPGLDEAGLANLALRCAPLARAAGARWILNGPPELALELDADGVHLNTRRLMAATRRPLGLDKLVAASCHDLEEIRHAAAVGVDFVTVSPVRRTASHPRAEPLGLGGLEQLCRHSGLPVYALGGLRPGDLAAMRQAGAFGVAGIRGFA